MTGATGTPTITLVVGHRGVGKTAWSRRVGEYFAESGRGCVTLDLDAEIERKTGRSVSALFSSRGEAAFRALERETLDGLIAVLRRRSPQHPSGGASGTDSIGRAFIVLGAGFCGPKPDGVDCLWIRRPTDAAGRVFANRPRLNPAMPPLDEFKARFREREDRYKEWADEIWLMSEGFDRRNDAERAFLLDGMSEIGGALTLLPENFRSAGSWERFIARRAGWGARFFEARDDLLPPEALALARAALPARNLLISFRNPAGSPPEASPWSQALADGSSWDWALELGEAPPLAWGRPTIVSLHERRPEETFERALARLTAAGEGSVLKAALETRDFRDLRTGHAWMMEEPQRRSFLPRSPDGRWAWYRLWMGDRSPLNFWREGDGSGADQPTLMDWWRAREAGRSESAGFAAILGDPVAHSLTCAEHEPFFRRLGMPVLRIRVREEEWLGESGRDSALAILGALGLRCAAVTSPLKRLAYRACAKRTGVADRFHAVNTLQWDGAARGWLGHNTDVAGLRALLDESSAAEGSAVAIWGGGGTLALVQDALPSAIAYSARTGRPREERASAPSVPPVAVVWAAGRDPSHSPPPAEWRPGLVIDLSYAENSPGFEYALSTGARYVSGLVMFRRQAEEQRKFWAEYVGK